MAMNQVNPNLNFGIKGASIDNPGGNSPSQESLNNGEQATGLDEITVSGADYKVNNLFYPDGVSSDMDKQHYIQFFINVRSKSKFLVDSEAKARGEFKAMMAKDNARVKELRSKQNRITDAANAAAGGTGASAGKLGAAALAAVGIVNKSILGSLVGGAAGLAGGVIGAEQEEVKKAIANSDLVPDEPVRITDVITLHIQDRPAVNYSAQYTEDSLGTLGGLLGRTDVSQIKNSGDLPQLGKEAGQAAALQLLNTVGGIGGSIVNSRRLLETGIKNITNPFREQFFERIDFRTFNFRHTFMPKNQTEANNVRSIINQFKFHMHPELVGTKNLMFLYPSEFDIKYMYRENENDYFNKISTCVLEDMNVEYGGDIFSTFEDGRPVEVNMTLRFKELELLTKERIKEAGL